MNNNSKHNWLVAIVVFILAFLLIKSCGGCVGCTGCAVSCTSCANEGFNGCTYQSGNNVPGNSSATQAPNVGLYAKDEFYINDYTSTLTEADKSSIVRMGEQLEKTYGVQLIAVVINDSEKLDNDSISSYAYALFNSWGIGDSNKNNGVLLLVNIAEGSYIGNAYCVEGTGLENLLPASDIGDIIDSKVLPNLDDRQFAAAVTEGYQALASRLTELYGGTDDND